MNVIALFLIKKLHLVVESTGLKKIINSCTINCELVTLQSAIMRFYSYFAVKQYIIFLFTEKYIETKNYFRNEKGNTSNRLPSRSF